MQDRKRQDRQECATQRKYLTGESPVRKPDRRDPLSSLGHIR